VGYSGLWGAISVSDRSSIFILRGRGGGRGIISRGRGRCVICRCWGIICNSWGTIRVHNWGRGSILNCRGTIAVLKRGGLLTATIQVEEDICEYRRFEEGEFAQKKAINQGGTSDCWNGDCPEIQEGFGISHWRSLGCYQHRGQTKETRLK
jgi:hypothetical protein